MLSKYFGLSEPCAPLAVARPGRERPSGLTSLPLGGGSRLPLRRGSTRPIRRARDALLLVPKSAENKATLMLGLSIAPLQGRATAGMEVEAPAPKAKPCKRATKPAKAPQLPKPTLQTMRCLLVTRHLSKWGRTTRQHTNRDPKQGWKAVHALVQAASAIKDLEAKARIMEAMRAAGEEIVTSVSSVEALAKIPYWQQGSLVLYHDDVVDARAALRHEPLVVAELQRWWFTALHSRREAADANLFELSLTKPDYVAVILRVGKVTCKDWTLAQGRKSADDDWLTDSRGCGTLNREMFMDAIFELADLWTATTEADEYVEFLRNLFDHIAAPRAASEHFWEEPLTEGGIPWGWVPLDQIKYASYDQAHRLNGWQPAEHAASFRVGHGLHSGSFSRFTPHYHGSRQRSLKQEPRAHGHTSRMKALHGSHSPSFHLGCYQHSEAWHDGSSGLSQTVVADHGAAWRGSGTMSCPLSKGVTYTSEGPLDSKRPVSARLKRRGHHGADHSTEPAAYHDDARTTTSRERPGSAPASAMANMRGSRSPSSPTSRPPRVISAALPVRPGSAVAYSPGLVQHRVLGSSRNRSTPALLPSEQDAIRDIVDGVRARKHPAGFAKVSDLPSVAQRADPRNRLRVI